MPRIQEYQPRISPVGGVGGAKLPVGTGADLARGVQNLGAGLVDLGQSVQQLQERREEARVRSKAIEFEANKAQEVEEAAKALDPSDGKAVDEFQRNFMEQAATDFDAIGQDVQTGRGRLVFDQLRAASMAEVQKRAYVQQSQVGGKHDRVMVEQGIQNAANAVSTDPTKYEYLMGSVEALIGTQRYLSLTDQEALVKDAQQTLSVSAVRGLISSGPGAPALALKQLEAGDWDKRVTPQAKDVLVAEAQQGINAERIEAERIRVEHDRVKKDHQEAKESLYIARMTPGTTANKAQPTTAVEIASDASLRPEQQRVLLSMMEAQNKDSSQPFRTNRGTLIELQRRMHLPYNDPQKVTNLLPVYEAFGKEQLTPSDRDWLIKEFNEAQTPDGQVFADLMQRARSTVHDSLARSIIGAVQPEVAAEAYYRFAHDLDRKVAEYREAKKDPGDLLDPTKPDYFLKPARIATYMDSARQTIQQAAGNAGADTSQYIVGRDYPWPGGGVRRYKGGDPTQASAWQVVQ